PGFRVTRKKTRRALALALTVGPVVPIDASRSWYRWTSSAVALSADRPRKSANFLTWRIYWQCVLGLSRRIVMSSISRRRNGLMALSVIGGSCLGAGFSPSISRQDRLLVLLPGTPRVL